MADPAELWSTYPVDDQPRPLVLVEEPVRIADSGFVDGSAKFAWLCGAITADIPLPDDLIGLLPPPKAESHVRPLTITSVSADQARFWTDRGPRELPAYRLVVDGLHEPCLVLDPGVPIWWPPADRRRLAGSAGRAELAPDEMTIHLPAHGGVLTEFDRAEFSEHDAYVVGRAITHQRPHNGPVIAKGVSGIVEGRLSRPLGNRVMVDQAGSPFIVIAPRRGQNSPLRPQAQMTR